MSTAISGEIPLCRRDGDDEGADPPDADDHACLARGYTAAAYCVEGDRERLRHRRSVVRAVVGHLTADGCRRCDTFGEASVRVQAERVVRGAEVDPPGATPFADTARDARARDDTIADRQVGDTVSDRDHAPDELVAEYHRWTRKQRSMRPLGRVRPADRRPKHLENDVADRRVRRLRNRLDPDVVPPVVHGCSHALVAR